jgi:hypothetical protein
MCLLPLIDGAWPGCAPPSAQPGFFLSMLIVIADLEPDAASLASSRTNEARQTDDPGWSIPGGAKPCSTRSKPRRAWPYLIVALGLCVAAAAFAVFWRAVEYFRSDERHSRRHSRGEGAAKEAAAHIGPYPDRLPTSLRPWRFGGSRAATGCRGDNDHCSTVTTRRPGAAAAQQRTWSQHTNGSPASRPSVV